MWFHGARTGPERGLTGGDGARTGAPVQFPVRTGACIGLVSQAICIFPRAHVRGKGGGGREGKICLVRCARFSFRLPECWQSQSNLSIQSN